jgi:3-methyladenine DNA glycosylase AlkD
MTGIKEAVREVRETLHMMGDHARRARMATYAPTAMEVEGVTGPELKGVIRDLKQKYREWDTGAWITLCVALVDTSVFECQVLAYELIGRNKKLLASLEKKDLDGLAKNLDNWASVDSFAAGIYGVLWGRGVVMDEDIGKLLDSEDHWQRRVAVVSTVGLNLKSRGGTGDTPRTLQVCEAVVGDHHEMIQKALSWALRELSKRDRKAVADFIAKHENQLARRVIREVNHKLDFGTKN